MGGGVIFKSNPTVALGFRQKIVYSAIGHRSIALEAFQTKNVNDFLDPAPPPRKNFKS